MVGSTYISSIVLDFLNNEGTLPEDPLEGMGAELAYIAIDGSIFPDGQQTAVRGNIEDAVGDALDGDLSGRTLGGAFGIYESYIDLLLLGGANSRQLVLQTLDDLQLHGRSRIESFM